jgi:hypothetical protein
MSAAQGSASERANTAKSTLSLIGLGEVPVTTTSTLKHRKCMSNNEDTSIQKTFVEDYTHQLRCYAGLRCT